MIRGRLEMQHLNLNLLSRKYALRLDVIVCSGGRGGRGLRLRFKESLSMPRRTSTHIQHALKEQLSTDMTVSI